MVMTPAEHFFRRGPFYCPINRTHGIENMKNRHGARLIRMLAGLHTRSAAERVAGTVLRRRLRTLLLALLPLLYLFQALSAQGQEAVRDTLSIRFRLDSTRVDLGYAANAQAWVAFQESFLTKYMSLDPAGTRLDIYAGASPEASAAHNEMLGRERGASIRRLVERRFGDRIGQIVVHNEGARWEGLYQAISASEEPWKEEVLAILRMPGGTNPNVRDPRETMLRTMHGGAVWKRLLTDYLPPLRSGGTAVLSWTNPKPAPERIVYVPTGRPGCCDCDTLVIKDTVVLYYIPEPKKEREPADQARVWALKTNLLLLGVGAPNVQAEIPLGTNNRWSVEGEFIFPWWTFSHNAYAEQVLDWGIEFKYWLGRRKYHPCLDGWHIGLAAAFGYYDLEWRSEGWQGEHVNGYLNIGYQHRWGRDLRWGIDAGLGVGALYTPRHRHYLGSTLFPENHTERYDDHLMYQNKGSLLWPGATHVNVTLMYFLDWKRNKKEEGGR